MFQPLLHTLLLTRSCQSFPEVLFLAYQLPDGEDGVEGSGVVGRACSRPPSINEEETWRGLFCPPTHTSATSSSPNCHLKVTTGQLPPALNEISAVLNLAAPSTSNIHPSQASLSSYTTEQRIQHYSLQVVYMFNLPVSQSINQNLQKKSDYKNCTVVTTSRYITVTTQTSSCHSTYSMPGLQLRRELSATQSPPAKFVRDRPQATSYFHYNRFKMSGKHDS